MSTQGRQGNRLKKCPSCKRRTVHQIEYRDDLLIATCKVCKTVFFDKKKPPRSAGKDPHHLFLYNPIRRKGM